MLDVAEEHVQARDEQREPGDEPGEERSRAGSPAHTVERASGTKTSDSTIRIDEHQRERDRLRRDHRERDELPREPHLRISSALSTIERDARLQRDGEEDPAGEPGEQVDRVVRRCSCS